MIYLVNPFDTEDEIGNRPLARCFQKSNVSYYISDCKPFIVAYLDGNLFLREMYTNEFLRKSNICNKQFAESEDILRFNDLIRFNAVSIKDQDEVEKLRRLKTNIDFILGIKKAIFNRLLNYPI